MDTRKARLHLTPGGRGATVEVDGHPLPAGSIHGVTIDAPAGDLPHLVVDFVMHEIEIEVDGEMTVHVPETTREALVALGWTPPEETPR